MWTGAWRYTRAWDWSTVEQQVEQQGRKLRAGRKDAKLTTLALSDWEYMVDGTVLVV